MLLLGIFVLLPISGLAQTALKYICYPPSPELFGLVSSLGAPDAPLERQTDYVPTSIGASNPLSVWSLGPSLPLPDSNFIWHENYTHTVIPSSSISITFRAIVPDAPEPDSALEYVILDVSSYSTLRRSLTARLLDVFDSSRTRLVVSYTAYDSTTGESRTIEVSIASSSLFALNRNFENTLVLTKWLDQPFFDVTLHSSFHNESIHVRSESLEARYLTGDYKQDAILFVGGFAEIYVEGPSNLLWTSCPMYLSNVVYLDLGPALDPVLLRARGDYLNRPELFNFRIDQAAKGFALIDSEGSPFRLALIYVSYPLAMTLINTVNGLGTTAVRFERNFGIMPRLLTSSKAVPVWSAGPPLLSGDSMRENFTHAMISPSAAISMRRNAPAVSIEPLTSTSFQLSITFRAAIPLETQLSGKIDYVLLDLYDRVRLRRVLTASFIDVFDSSRTRLLVSYTSYDARTGAARTIDVAIGSSRLFAINRNFENTLVLTKWLDQPFFEVTLYSSFHNESIHVRSESLATQFTPLQHEKEAVLMIGGFALITLTGGPDTTYWKSCPVYLSNVVFLDLGPALDPSFIRAREALLNSSTLFDYRVDRTTVTVGSNLTDSEGFPFPTATPEPAPQQTALILGISLGVVGLILAVSAVALLFWKRRRQALELHDMSKANVVSTSPDERPEYEQPELFRFIANAVPDLPSRRQTNAGEMLALDFLPSEVELTAHACLARGFFGSVFVFRGSEDGRLYALKIFETRMAGSTASTMMDYLREVQVLSALRHPYIVSYVGHALYPSGRPALVMSFEEGLSLSNHLYPEVHLVMPRGSDYALQAQTFEDLRQMVDGFASTRIPLGGFMSIVGECTSEDTAEGRRHLEHAARGSRFTVIGDHPGEEGQLHSNPLALALQEPCLIVYHGARVHRWPLSWGLATGPGSNYLFDFFVDRLEFLPKLSMYDRVRLAFESWQGIHFLHRQKPVIIHSDIKPQNLLLDSLGRARVADVGLAQEVNLRSSHAMSYVTNVAGLAGGTQGYEDPARKDAAPKFGEKNDVYSFGIVLLELFPETYSGPSELILWMTEIILGALSPWKDRLRSGQLLQQLHRAYELAYWLFPDEHEVRLRLDPALDQLLRAPSNARDSSSGAERTSDRNTSGTISSLGSIKFSGSGGSRRTDRPSLPPNVGKTLSMSEARQFAGAIPNAWRSADTTGPGHVHVRDGGAEL